MSLYVGIDNGVSGGICAVSPNSLIVAWTPMPVKKSRSANEVDIRALHHWLTDATGDDLTRAVYVLEEPGGSKSAKAAKSMAGSFHAIRGFLETKGLRYERITPQSWQKNLLPGCKSGETKQRALAKAAELWPAETFIPERCRTPNDGVIDAALIAEYGRRHTL